MVPCAGSLAGLGLRCQRTILPICQRLSGPWPNTRVAAAMPTKLNTINRTMNQGADAAGGVEPARSLTTLSITPSGRSATGNRVGGRGRAENAVPRWGPLQLGRVSGGRGHCFAHLRPAAFIVGQGLTARPPGVGRPNQPPRRWLIIRKDLRRTGLTASAKMCKGVASPSHSTGSGKPL